MKKLIIAILTSLSLSVNGQVAVFDASNLTYQLEQIEHQKSQIDHMYNQITQLKAQVEQTKKQYEAVTGTRNLGEIFNNSALKNVLPSEWKNIYNASQNGNYGISGSISDILKEEKYIGSITDMQKSIQARSQQSTATDKAIGLKAYEGAQQRLAQIESLMKKINSTQDPKAISELQARISVEQATIQNETSKLQMISQLQQAEKQLVEEQKKDMNYRILNSNNKSMPTIQ